MFEYEKTRPGANSAALPVCVRRNSPSADSSWRPSPLGLSRSPADWVRSWWRVSFARSGGSPSTQRPTRSARRALPPPAQPPPPAADRLVEPDLPLLGQRHGRDRGQGLGDRAEVEEGIRCHGLPRVEVPPPAPLGGGHGGGGHHGTPA